MLSGIAFLWGLVVLNGVLALDNGLALTPPMGWLAWERFRCNTDCDNDPDNCISEKLFMTMSDLMVSEGYRDVGYDIISLDDCWLSHDRDVQGKLQPDPIRFPSGIQALANYVHGKGLKFGIYEDFGTKTCAGYPGIQGHLQLDAQTFADWSVDYVKIDGCNVDPKEMDEGYPAFGHYLNHTGRPMIYSCEWPWYQRGHVAINWTAIVATCNLWRNNRDITDSWSSVTQVINYYGDNQDEISPLAGPGQWNDPDELIVGDFGLSYDQSKSQMAMWAMMASPLMMSVDLRKIGPMYKAILQNKDIITVNQDALGIQGRRIIKRGSIEIWCRPINPSSGKDHSYAIVILNQSTAGRPSKVTLNLRSLGMDHKNGYVVTDLYSKMDHGRLTPDQDIQVLVNPTGVVMLKCIIISNTIDHHDGLFHFFKVFLAVLFT